MDPQLCAKKSGRLECPSFVCWLAHTSLENGRLSCFLSFLVSRIWETESRLRIVGLANTTKIPRALRMIMRAEICKIWILLSFNFRDFNSTCASFFLLQCHHIKWAKARWKRKGRNGFTNHPENPAVLLRYFVCVFSPDRWHRTDVQRKKKKSVWPVLLPFLFLSAQMRASTTVSEIQRLFSLLLLSRACIKEKKTEFCFCKVSSINLCTNTCTDATGINMLSAAPFPALNSWKVASSSYLREKDELGQEMLMVRGERERKKRDLSSLPHSKRPFSLLISAIKIHVERRGFLDPFYEERCC